MFKLIKIEHVSVISLLFFFNYGLHAQNPVINQNVISTAGDRFQNNNIIIDWTLGEMAISMLYGNSKIISQGFHQPRLVVTSTNDIHKEIGKISVYPNPTQDYININLKFSKEEQVLVVLSDNVGRLLWNQKYYGQDISDLVSLIDFSNGTYILRFYIEKSQTSQSFKIQKIN